MRDIGVVCNLALLIAAGCTTAPPDGGAAHDSAASGDITAETIDSPAEPSAETASGGDGSVDGDTNAIDSTATTDATFGDSVDGSDASDVSDAPACDGDIAELAAKPPKHCCFIYYDCLAGGSAGGARNDAGECTKDIWGFKKTYLVFDKSCCPVLVGDPDGGYCKEEFPKDTGPATDAPGG